ncbi:MAG: hypothetical protein LBK75_03455 [Oscillospiraceae bacterium]|jgi:stage IV sporulation protein FB|nr:hypothetical protein [Oscillospiraceae bacterium]
MTWGRLTVQGGFLLLMTFLVFLDSAGLLLWIAAAAFVHEAGHWVVLRLVGGRVARWELSLRGVAMRLPVWPALSYGRELLATLAGPAANLMCAFAAALWAGRTKDAGLYTWAGVSLFQGGFNLLPARGQDGGHALHLLLRWRWHAAAADRALTILTGLCAAGAAAAGLWAYHTAGRDITVLAAAAYAALSLLAPGEGRGPPNTKFLEIV